MVQVGSGTGTDAGGSNLPTANTEFQSDWPDGKEGFTVEIGSLPKQGTTGEQVEAAKSDATDKGASDVGALDSDDFGSLPSGNYVIYSGVYDTKADATKALKAVKSDFPGLLFLTGLVLGVLGLQGFILALVGEYMARIQRDVEGRPLYTIERELQ